LLSVNLSTLVFNVVSTLASWVSFIDEASKGKIDEGWPASNTAEKLRQWKLNVVVEPNDKNITIAHFERPLGQLKLLPTQDVLFCLGTGKIKMTYTGNKSDLSGRVTRPYKKRKRLVNNEENSTTESGSGAAANGANNPQSAPVSTQNASAPVSTQNASAPVLTQNNTSNNTATGLESQVANRADSSPSTLVPTQ
jgi:hypothetical protein